MGERATGLMTTHAPPEELVHEIALLRANLTGIAAEIDRRRHELLDWRLQLRRHTGAIALATTGLVLLGGGAIAVAVTRARRRDRPMQRVKRMREAIHRAWESPEHLAQTTPNVGKKVLAALFSAAAGALGKLLVERLIARKRDLDEEDR